MRAPSSRQGDRIVVAFRVLLTRPQQPRVTHPDSTVGVDVGVRVLATVATPDGTVLQRIPNPRALEVVLFAIVYAKILEEHPAVADLGLIGRTVREPDERRPDPRPDRERFFRREGGLWVLAVVEFGERSAVIVTVFSADRPPD